jgi:hypothetical protein
MRRTRDDDVSSSPMPHHRLEFDRKLPAVFLRPRRSRPGHPTKATGVPCIASTYSRQILGIAGRKAGGDNVLAIAGVKRDRGATITGSPDEDATRGGYARRLSQLDPMASASSPMRGTRSSNPARSSGESTANLASAQQAAGSGRRHAGVRVFGIEDPFQPREAGFFVPPDPERMFDPRPNRPKVIQSADCFVDAQGVMYLTDNNAGLYVLQFEGA